MSCPVDMRDHVPHWPFLDGTMLVKTKNATKEKSHQQQRQSKKSLFKMIFWGI